MANGKPCEKPATHGIFRWKSSPIGRYGCSQHASEYRRSGWHIITLALLMLSTALGQPRLNLVLPPPPPAKHLFFTATAYNTSYIESDYCNEVDFAYTNQTQVTLAWNASPSSNVMGYRVYWGPAVRFYTNSLDCGPGLQQTITFVPPPPPVTNYGAVYAQSSTNAGSGYKDMSTNPVIRFTNVVGAPNPPKVFYRVRVTNSLVPIP